MRPFVSFLVLGAVMLMLAAVAIGGMISIANNRPSYLLIGVFAVDSAALLLLAGHLTLRRHNGRRH